MIKIIDNHTLSYPLHFDNEYEPTAINQEVVESIGGTAIIYEKIRLSGQLIKLVTPKDSYIKQADVDKIMTLAKALNDFYIEDDEANTIKVHIHHAGGGVKIKPLQPKFSWYTAEINLIVVE